MRRSLPPRVAALGEAIGRVMRRVIGVPDYEAYVAHHARQQAPQHRARGGPMSREAFTREMLARRFERPGHRCC